MTKRIDRSRIESGKFELPRALGFLTDQKVDFLSLTDRDGDYTVELSASALRSLVKAKADLKALKASQKQAAAGHDAALAEEREAHAGTQRELASALRKLKKLSPAEAPAPARKGASAKAATKAPSAKKGAAKTSEASKGAGSAPGQSDAGAGGTGAGTPAAGDAPASPAA